MTIEWRRTANFWINRGAMATAVAATVSGLSDRRHSEHSDLLARTVLIPAASVARAIEKTLRLNLAGPALDSSHLESLFPFQQLCGSKAGPQTQSAQLTQLKPPLGNTPLPLPAA